MITFTLAYTSATHTHTHTHTCMYATYVRVMYVCTCTRHPVDAADTDIQAAWSLFPSPVGSERAVAAARVWVRRMPTSNCTPVVPFLGSAAERKPLQLTQESADARRSCC